MSIKPEAIKKVNFYKKMLFYVNCPLMVGIPALLHSSLLNGLAASKLENLTYLLTFADAFLFIDSILIYTIINKIVT